MRVRFTCGTFANGSNISQFDPAALLFATEYLPTSTLANGEVSYGVPLSQTCKEYVVRGDQVLSSKDRLFARYYLNKYNNNPFLSDTNYLATVSSAQIYSHNAIVGETHVFTSNLLNDLRLSFARVSTNAGPPSNSISVADLEVKIYQPPQFRQSPGQHQRVHLLQHQLFPTIDYQSEQLLDR